MELDFSQLMQLILTGVILVQSAMIHRSIPRESWDKYLAESDAAVAKTSSTLDDKFAALQRGIVTNLMERAGFFQTAKAEASQSIIDPAIKERIEAPTIPPFTNVTSNMTPIAGTNVSFYTPDETDRSNG